MLTNKEALNVGLIHLKQLVEDLDRALALAQEGYAINGIAYLELRDRARNFIEKGVVTETLMGECTMALTFVSDSENEDELA